MFHYFGRCNTGSGDSLPAWQVEVVQLSDLSTVIPLYANESGTPIGTVSGITNRAVCDAQGNFDFFVDEGTYAIRYYSAEGVYQSMQRYVQMYAGTASGKANSSAIGISDGAANMGVFAPAVLPDNATAKACFTALGEAVEASGTAATYSPSTSYPAGSVGAKLSDIVSIKDYGAKGDGVTDDTSIVNSVNAASGSAPVFVPYGRYQTTLTAYQAIAKRYYGDGQLVMGGYGQARQRSFINSAQPVPDNDRTKFFDGGFNKAHRASYSFVGPSANPSSLPSVYTNYSEWSADVHIHDFTAGFNKDAADHALGRSGAWKEELRLYHGGQGDLVGRHFYGEAYTTRAGATHWLSTPALIVENGNLSKIAGTGAGFLNHSEYIYSDNGNDIAVIDHVRNFNRTNETSAIGQIWGYLRPQSSGSKAVDFVLSPSGLFRNGIDFGPTTLGSSKGAVVLKQSDRIYYNGVSTADGLGAKWYSQSCGDTFTYFDTDNRWKLAVGGVSVFQPSANDVYLAKPILLTLDGAGAGLFANGQATFAAASNTSFVIKYRGSDGVTRTGTITLS